MAIHHYMVMVPVNTSGYETMHDGVMRRLKELADSDENELFNLIKVFEAVR